MHILLAEDDEPKLIKIRAFLQKEFSGSSIDAARSVTSTLASIRARKPDVLVLDMSLPTFEIALGERGGRPQDYGGLTVMEFMDFEDLVAPVVMVTQYEAFPGDNGANRTLEEIAADARKNHPSMFRGLIYYSSVENTWEEPLKDAIITLSQESSP